MRLRAAIVAGVLAAAAAAQEGGSAPMVALPSGLFVGGERVGALDDTWSWHRVSRFHLDRTEVTVAEYAACVRAGRCNPASTTVHVDGLFSPQREEWSTYCNADRPDRADHPVNCVAWSQAKAYCEFAGKRLPSEEEWEWAARGGKAATVYPWGAAPPDDERACWSGGPGGFRGGTCPVGGHPPGGSPAGAQDLAGNVWEWTATADVIFADSRGRGGTPVRIARGGSWADSTPGNLVASRRAKMLPGDRAADLGFRCARDR